MWYGIYQQKEVSGYVLCKRVNVGLKDMATPKFSCPTRCPIYIFKRKKNEKKESQWQINMWETRIQKRKNKTKIKTSDTCQCILDWLKD